MTWNVSLQILSPCKPALNPCTKKSQKWCYNCYILIKIYLFKQWIYHYHELATTFCYISNLFFSSGVYSLTQFHFLITSDVCTFLSTVPFYTISQVFSIKLFCLVILDVDGIKVPTHWTILLFISELWSPPAGRSVHTWKSIGRFCLFSHAGGRTFVEASQASLYKINNK